MPGLGHVLPGKYNFKNWSLSIGNTCEIPEPVTNFLLPFVASGMVAAFLVGLYPAAYFP